MSYRVKGTTDDTTTCEQCGRTNLRKTVILAELDADGNEEGVSYLGTDCAARKTGTRQRVISDKAAAADRHMSRAREWAQEMGDFYGTVSRREAIERYVAANRNAVNPVERVNAVLAEVASIQAGNLAGTRFEPQEDEF